MQLSSALSWRKAAPPREEGAGDEEAARVAIDNPFPRGGSSWGRQRSNQINKLTAVDLRGKSKRDLVTHLKRKYDSNGDGVFQDNEVEDMLYDTIEICESKEGLEVEKDMMLNKLRKMNRRMKIMGGMGTVLIIASVLGTYFGSKSTFSQGTIEVKDSIVKSKTTSVGLDSNGHSHLQDAKSGLDISTRGFGDTFHTQAKVDPSSRRKLSCMKIEEIADLFQDTMSRTEASVVIVDEDGLEKQVVPINGQFVDNGRTLHFGRGEDSVTVIMDSDVCNTAILPAELEDIQVKSVEEEEVAYQLDIDAAVEDAMGGAKTEEDSSVPANEGIFNRARNLIGRLVGMSPQDSGAVVEDPPMADTSRGGTDKDHSRHLFSPSSSEVLARHRNEFEIAKRSPRGERKMQESGGDSVEICSGDGCESPFPVLTNQGYGSVIENGACVSDGDRLPYNNIVNNSPAEGPDGIEMDCVNFCSPYSGVDGYVGFSLRFEGTSNLQSFPIGRCQCQFKQGTVRPEDTSGATSVWWGSSASGHVDLAMGNGNNNYVCYPWSDAMPFCGITEGYSDGSAGDLIIDADGTMALNGNALDSTTLGTAPDATTVLENINNFIIAAGQAVDVLGTLIVKAKHIQIDGTLNGNGRGYVGAAAAPTANGAHALSGESPPDTNGHGTGGKSASGHFTGGGGASHAGRGGWGGEDFCSPGWSTRYGNQYYDHNCNSGGSPGDVHDDTLPLTLHPGSGGGGGAGCTWNENSAGCYGGAGGAGGAAMLFYSEKIVINGNIYANGSNGGRGPDGVVSLGGGGGGSGGSVHISACTLTAGSSANIEAMGGSGGQAREYGYGGGGGGGGVFVLEATTVNYDDSMTINVSGGNRGEGHVYDSRAGFAGSAGKVFLPQLPSNLEIEDSCDLLPSYLDPTPPLDKNARCATGFCRTTDNKCGCTSNNHCDSSEVCRNNKCYSPLRIFVTSKTYKGNLGGYSGADNKCQNLANNAGLDGTFRAWLTTDSYTPSNNWFHAIPNRPYYLVDDTTKVADDWNHLYSLDHAINKDEYGNTVTNFRRVWTNTNWNGDPASDSANCNNWTTNSILKSGKYGWIDSTGPHWSWKGGTTCNWASRLYCIQQNTNS